MLKHISSIWEYRDFLSSQETYLDSSQFKRLHSSLFRSALHKLRKLDPGLVSDLLFSLYSCQGRPAIDPAILIRSFVLMQHFKYTSIHNWCEALHSDILLQYLIGTFSPPSPASHYDILILMIFILKIFIRNLIQRTNLRKVRNSSTTRMSRLTICLINIKMVQRTTATE